MQAMGGSVTAANNTVTNFPVLAGIPEISTSGDIERQHRLSIIKVAAVVMTVVGGLLVFHFFIMDLNIFWAKLMRRLAL